MEEAIKIILYSEAFLIVVSGVIIFSLQKLISELWIGPSLRFTKTMTKLEILISKTINFYPLSKDDYQTTSGRGKTAQEEIQLLKAELFESTWELLSAYYSLFFLERWFLRLRGINVLDAKPVLSILSVKLGDWEHAWSKDIESDIKDVSKLLKLNTNIKD